MKTTMRRARRLSRTRTDFKIGDRVKFLFGVRQVRALVVEDMGPIGVGGRRLLRVRLLDGDRKSVV